MSAFRKVLQVTLNTVEPAKSTVDVAYFESEEAYNAGKAALKVCQLPLEFTSKTVDDLVAVAEDLLDYIATDFASAAKVAEPTLE